MREYGFRFDKSIAQNRKILNWFETGLRKQLHPKCNIAKQMQQTLWYHYSRLVEVDVFVMHSGWRTAVCTVANYTDQKSPPAVAN